MFTIIWAILLFLLGAPTGAYNGALEGLASLREGSGANAYVTLDPNQTIDPPGGS